MQTIIAAVLVFAVALAAMAVGVIFTGRRLQGSCGGTGRDCTCDEATRADCELAKRASGSQEGRG